MKKASEILYSTEKFHITLGLERIQKMLSILNNPQDDYRIIHVAGTNGKGSTCKILNEFLITAGYKTGLFTSPHLFSYEERIKINNKDIDSDIFDDLINEIDNLAKKNDISLSEFELLSACAFYYFSKQKVDFVVLEVGLGGLFDATNVAIPDISVITTIDFDHTERLGKTIEEISIQKAGIIKENIPLVISKQNLGYKTIKELAHKKNSKIIEPINVEIEFQKHKNYAYFENKKFLFNLLGTHQKENLGLALSAIKEVIKLDDKIIENALKSVIWRFRLEYHPQKNLLIDGAHNPSGANVLRNFLNENFKNEKKTFIFGCLKNKEYQKMLDILIKDDDKLYFYEFDYPNALKFSELKHPKAIKIQTIDEIDEIIKNNQNLKIICGSLYMLGNTFKKIDL